MPTSIRRLIGRGLFSKLITRPTGTGQRSTGPRNCCAHALRVCRFGWVRRVCGRSSPPSTTSAKKLKRVSASSHLGTSGLLSPRSSARSALPLPQVASSCGPQKLCYWSAKNRKKPSRCMNPWASRWFTVAFDHLSSACPGRKCSVWNWPTSNTSFGHLSPVG